MTDNLAIAKLAAEMRARGEKMLRTFLVSDCDKWQETVERLCGAVRWALGETDFRPREDGEPPYWWRTELRQKSGLQWDPEMKRSVLERTRAVAEAEEGRDDGCFDAGGFQ